jgi:hypothetical protein
MADRARPDAKRWKRKSILLKATPHEPITGNTRPREGSWDRAWSMPDAKTRAGGHLKQSGRFWSETGVETIHGLRCLILGPHTDEARKQPGNLVTRQKAKVRGRSGEPEKRAAWIFRPAPCSDDDSPRKDETGLPQSEGPPAVSGDAPPEPAPSSGRMRSTRRLMPSSANSLCG